MNTNMRNLRCSAGFGNGFSVAVLAAFLVGANPAFGFAGFDYTARDVVIGFRQASGPEELVVDLGQATNFHYLTPGSVTQITNYSQATLDDAFSSLGGVSWSVFSSVLLGQGDGNQPNYTVWATEARTDTNVQSATLLRQKSSRQSSAGQGMAAVGNNANTYANTLAPDGLTDTATSVVIPAGNSLGYYHQIGPNGNFNNTFLDGDIENTTSANFGSPGNCVVSDFYELQPAPTTVAVPGVYHGFFTFKSDGTMTYTAAYGAPPVLTSISPSTGAPAGGTTVTLTGSGFVNGRITVEFGGVPAASVQFVNSTTVTAVSPAGAAGVTDVLVANSDGQSSDLASAFTYANPPPPCDTAPSGLISWWKGEGNTFDVIGGNLGAIYNTVTYAPGEVGQAFNFNSDSAMVVAGNPANLQLQNFTLEAWVQRTSATVASSDPSAGNGDGLWFAYGQGGYGFGLSPSGQLFLTQVGVDSVNASAGVADTAWHHVAATVSGGTVVFYVDGVAYPAGAYNRTYQFTTPAAIGGRADHLNGSDNESFWGAIDEMSIYNRALAANEIAGIYNAGISGKCVPPINITWNSPADIVYGTALSSAQLNATANVAGTFSYNPPAGMVLPAGGVQTLSVTFTPADMTDYPNPLTQTVAINVGQAALTITAQPQTIIYGASVPSSTVSYSGFVNGDTSASLTTPPSVASGHSGVVNAGTYAGNYTASGAVDNNYTITYASGALTVNPAALTIAAQPQTIIYGASVPSSTVNYSGFVNGDTSASLTTPPSVSSAHSGVVNAGTYAGNYTASGAVDNNYAISYANGALTVNPAALTITAQPQTITYGASVPSSTVSYSGFVNGDTSASLTTLPSVSSAHGGVVNAGTYTGNYTASGAVDNNYTITYANGTLTVNPAALTITAQPQAITYGASVPSTTVSYSGFVNSDTSASLTTPPSVSSARSGVVNAGTYTGNYTASGAVDNNYAITYASGTLTVNPAALTITAQPQTITYGASVPSSTVSYSGFVNGETSASLTTPPSVASARSGVVNAGTYAGNYTVSGVEDNNYTITYASGTLTVNPAALTITAQPQTITYGASVPSSTVSYSGFVNGDTSASLTTPPSVSSAHSGVLNAGTYTGNYTVSGAVDNNYTITYASGALTVNPAALTVTASNQNKTYGQTVTFAGTEFATSGLVNGDTVTSVTLSSSGAAATATVAGSPYSIVPGAALGTGLANYAITYADGTLTVGKATPVITWANPSAILYPVSLTGTQLDATANVPGSFNYNPPAGTVLSVGSGQTLSTTFTPADTGDYNTASAEVTINVVTCEAAPSGLVSWWKGEGNTFDVIGGNTGTLEPGVTFVAGEVGQAFDFSGNQQMVAVGSPANLQLQNFTLEAWVQRTSATVASSDPSAGNGDGLWFAYGQGGYGFGLSPSGQLFLTQVGVDSVNASAGVADTAWHHVAATVSGGTVVFYVDGVAYPAGAYNRTYQFTTPAAIGGRADHLNGSDNESFWGAIDEMSVYNRALAAAEVSALYDNGPGGKCVPVVVINWSNPADMVYGVPLTSAQLNATANVAGTLSYNPPAGTVLPEGAAQTLSVTFTPADRADYPNPVTQTVAINVYGPPVPGVLALSTTENNAVGLPVANLLAKATGGNGGPYSITAVSPLSAQGGTVTMAGGLIAYTPPDNFLGSDSFTYTLFDGAASAQGTVPVTVATSNPPSSNSVSIVSLSGKVLIEFLGIPGQVYVMQSATSVPGPWTDLSGPLTAGTTGLIIYTDTNPQRIKFYRMRVGP
jgi:hypothetical protein